MYSYRTDVENTYHHITNRGVNKYPIFRNNDDKNYFVEKLKVILKELDIILIAYIIMNNHFHLFIKRQTNSMAKFMQKLLTSYALYYNKKYERTGHVFERRYYSTLIDSENYFMNVLIYIHQNIIRKHPEMNIQNYKWNSYKDYINFDSSLVNIKHTFNILGWNKKYFLENFFEIHNDILPKNYIDGKNIRGYNILGNKNFIEVWMEKLQADNRKNIELNNTRKITQNDIFNFISNSYKINKKELMDTLSYNNHNWVSIRKKVYYLLNKYCGLSYVKIGKIFNIHSNTVSYHIKSLKNKNFNNDFIKFINT